jgi:Omp85 superfamily domain
MPDYGSLDERSSDGVVWVPRVLTAPLYAITELGVRAPIGALTRTAEKHHWAGTLYELFTSDDRKVGVFPSAFVDFGVRPSVGFFFFWNDAFAPKNDLRFHFGTWGPTWINVSAVDRYTFAPKKTVSLRAAFSRRQDLYFNGLGPESTHDHESRYEANRLDVGPAFEIDGWRLNSLRLAAGIRRIDYGDGGCCDDARLQTRVARGDFPLPPHFGSAYTSLYQRAQVVVDTRQPKPYPGTGFRLEVYGEPSFHPRPQSPESWVRWGAEVGQTVDLNGLQRNLSLSVAVDFADPIVGRDVPFNEQVILGGGQTPAGAFVGTKMRGFRYGRLVGRSAAVATLQYTWPVWFLLEGVIQVSAGNVFGGALRGFDTDLARLSGVIGVRTNQERDAHFEILLGAGTETIREGLALESFRLAIGTTHGF